MLIPSAAPGAPVQTPKDQVELIGAYSQFRETGEHVYGRRLELWRDDKTVLGHWARAEGEPADFPTVTLEDLHWNESTGALRFTAKWCDETESFDGVLNDGGVVGTITSKQRTNPQVASSKITLRKVRNYPIGSMPRADWRALMDSVLKRLAPRC